MTRTVYDWDTYRTIPGLKDLFDLVGQRETTQRLMAARRSSESSAVEPLDA